MKFAKMHGLGNDFIVVDGFDERLEEAALPALAQRLCDRHFGIGADGILLALPSREAEFRMRLINADGSEAEHCGNGIRCIAKFVADRGRTSADRITIETVGRINVLDLNRTGGRVETVRVDMGEPRFGRRDLPMTGPPADEAIDEPVDVEGRRLELTCVSIGNPHAVCFVEDPDNYPVQTVGPLVENHPLFPRRTNVEFIRVLGPQELQMRVWERGAGETLACGTGACASVVASARTGRSDRRATVHLRGGDLEIEWAANNRVYMTGPAVWVFDGEVLL